MTGAAVPGVHVVPLEGEAWSDARGWGLRPLDAARVAPRAVGEMHVVSLEPGAVRGNHRHPGTTEWLLLCGGPVTLAWSAEGRVASRTVEGAEPFLVRIEPGVPHAVRSEASETRILVSWSDGPPVTEAVEPLLR